MLKLLSSNTKLKSAENLRLLRFYFSIGQAIMKKNFQDFNRTKSDETLKNAKENLGTIDNEDESRKSEHTIDLGHPKENKVKIQNLYDIKSKKMGPPNINAFIDSSRITNKNVSLGVFNSEKFNKDNSVKFTPVSPKLGPFEIVDPKLENKTYHWCSCGMSKKQPFCDMSHKNSKLRPISFKLGEKCDSMLLCGCKLSSKAPFCDGQTCVTLKAKEEEELYKKIKNLNK